MSAVKKQFAEVIIHIGTERTGSKSIQTVIARNREILLRQGVLVPRSLSFGDDLANHVNLLMMCSPRTHFADLCPPQLMANAQDIGQWQRQLIEKLYSELDRTSKDVSRILISNEHLHSRLTTANGVQGIVNILEPYTDRFVIIVFLRPQIECAISLFNLALRRGATEFRLIPQFDGVNGFDRVVGVGRSYFQYDELLSRYESAFGAQSIRPFIYQTGPGADPLSILARETRVTLPAIAFKNSSINAEAQQFQLMLNKSIKEAQQEYGPDLLVFIDDFLTSNYRGRGLLPTRSDASAFMETFAPGNERVRSKYFPENTHLFEPSWERYPEKSGLMEGDSSAVNIGLNLLRAVWLRSVKANNS